MPVIDGLTPETMQSLLIGIVVYLLLQPLILFFAAKLLDLRAASYWRSLLAAVLQLLVIALSWLALSQGSGLLTGGWWGLSHAVTLQVFAFLIQLAGLLLFWWIAAQVFRCGAAAGFAVLLVSVGMLILVAWIAAFIVRLVDPALLAQFKCCAPPPVV